MVNGADYDIEWLLKREAEYGCRESQRQADLDFERARLENWVLEQRERQAECAADEETLAFNRGKLRNSSRRVGAPAPAAEPAAAQQPFTFAMAFGGGMLEQSLAEEQAEQLESLFPQHPGDRPSYAYSDLDDPVPPPDDDVGPPNDQPEET